MKRLSLLALLTTNLAFAEYCLGPENAQANAPVGPKTCNGDITFSIAGFYWNAHQDGLEYAINDAIAVPVINPTQENLEEINRIVDAKYESPGSNWEFGFQFAVGYVTPCDGWDLKLRWTHFHTLSSHHAHAGVDENHILITLWSAFAPQHGAGNFARDIDANWKVKLDLVDFELGRDFWTSQYLSFRPHVGLRYANIRQDFDLEQMGGSWSPRVGPDQDPFNNYVDIDNDYKGVGLRLGFDTSWNFGCGWALISDLSTSILSGRFDIEHEEYNRLAISDYEKTEVLHTKDRFRALRAILDLFLGVRWSTLFCDCKYGIAASLGYETHLFFDQNQMWRVIRIGDVATSDIPNNTGENVFHQRRGSLSTQGWTLTLQMEF